ncbi:MAG: hypothetical protein WA021_02975 [Minisyncoccia bacterium]
MLSLFPELLYLSPMAAFLIRIAVGLLLAYAAYRHMSDTALWVRILAGVQAISAVLLFVGAYTQAIALFAFVLAILSLATTNRRIYPVSTLLLGAVLAFTLILTGPGPFAFDLPL